MLSRLPLPQTPSEIPIPGETLLVIDMLQSVPVSAQQIWKWTDQDPVLSAVRSFVLKGWPSKVTDRLTVSSAFQLRPMFWRQNQLAFHGHLPFCGKALLQYRIVTHHMLVLTLCLDCNVLTNSLRSVILECLLLVWSPLPFYLLLQQPVEGSQSGR